MRSALCDELGIEYPIFAFTHCRDVVAAVGQAGGMGVLGAVGFDVDQLAMELDWIEQEVAGKPTASTCCFPRSSPAVIAAASTRRSSTSGSRRGTASSWTTSSTSTGFRSFRET